MNFASIIIPHYRTPRQLRMCIKLIRHYTVKPYELIIVDNGSEERDIQFLQNYPDIILIRRLQKEMDMIAHGEALDVGIERAKGSYVVTLHSDSFVIHRDWLTLLIRRLEKNGYDIYGPSTHRLYPVGWYERLKSLYVSKDKPHMIRPLFSIYRADIFVKDRFSDHQDVGGLSIPYVEAGRAGFLAREEACRYVFHIGGTTRLTNLQHRKKAQRKKDHQFKEFLGKEEVRRVLNAKDETD